MRNPKRRLCFLTYIHNINDIHTFSLWHLWLCRNYPSWRWIMGGRWFAWITRFLSKISSYLALLMWHLIFRKIENWIRMYVVILTLFWRLLFMGSLYNNRSTHSCHNGCYSNIIQGMVVSQMVKYSMQRFRVFSILWHNHKSDREIQFTNRRCTC